MKQCQINLSSAIFLLCNAFFAANYDYSNNMARSLQAIGLLLNLLCAAYLFMCAGENYREDL